MADSTYERPAPHPLRWVILTFSATAPFLGDYGLVLALLVGGIQVLKTGMSDIERGVRADEHPIRFRFGLILWFVLALYVLFYRGDLVSWPYP